MSPSDVAAWWGATVASVVFGWDVYKWKSSGVRLAGYAISNMKHYVGATASDELHVVVRLVNRGDRPVTLTHLGFRGFRSRLHKFFRRSSTVGHVPEPGGTRLPHLLAPGAEWLGMVKEQTVWAQQNTGRIYAAISHTASDREMLVYVERRNER